ncbi:MAG: NAD-dependent epimerase/dehydratase family protein [Bacteroidota bacterium]
MGTILVTGARGQIGSDLVAELRRRHGRDAVLETDLHPLPNGGDALYETLDVQDRDRLASLVRTHDVETVYHLASLLSATGERKPDLAWSVNVEGLRNVLRVARGHGLRVFWPSSIAAFGPATPREDTPQAGPLDPVTMYGVTKVSGELLCRYAFRQDGVDVRSLRYPGLISYAAKPGGGTTDYAVEMFYAALRDEPYICFLRPDTRLPMMYMPDAVRATIDLMDADADAISVRTSYNITAFSFSAEALAAALRKRFPSFKVAYHPDFRQAIADSWPASIDDRQARADWGWQPAFDLDRMVDDMIEHLAAQLSVAEPS